MVTWLAREAMVAREVLATATAPPVTVVETFPVLVPRLDIPETQTHLMDATFLRALKLWHSAGVLHLPVVALTTSVVTLGLVPTAPGETSLTPLIGTVLRIVLGVPGAPFNTT